MSSKDKRRARGLRRHLEGWEVGVVSVALAGLAALLAVPRPVAPEQIPLPRIHREQFSKERARWAAAAEAALESPLPYDVRAAGEAFRAVGRAATLPGGDVGAASARFRRRVAVARKAKGDEPLLALRGVQLRMFFAALRRWRATGRADLELTELAGGFADEAARRGWFDDQKALRPDDDELAALFVVRWTDLAGLMERHPFSPTLDTWRVYYRFQILHGVESSDTRVFAGLVEALERRDPRYPARLARGILQFKFGRRADAAETFRAHLQLQPHGPWTLRARNYLAAALDSSVEPEP